MENNEEYFRRNLLVAQALGARAGVAKGKERVMRLKHPPQWLITLFDGVLDRLEPLPRELAAHRDEVHCGVNRVGT